jgi:hypothetical protein
MSPPRRTANPGVAVNQRVIDEVLADHDRFGYFGR